MIEKKGNIWDGIGVCNAICITTNGIVKNNGALVMGAGIALDAVRRFPGLDLKLGSAVSKYGNVPAIGTVTQKTAIISFPTKNNFKDKSDISLIVKSANLLTMIADKLKWQTIFMTRPGCGLGGLEWLVVYTHISPILDNRFIIWSK